MDKYIEALIEEERQYQKDKWGEYKSQSIPGYLLIMKKELEEAEEGWMKNTQGRHSALHEILQVVCVGIACLEEHWGKSEEYYKTPRGFTQQTPPLCDGDIEYPPQEIRGKKYIEPGTNISMRDLINYVTMEVKKNAN